MSNFKVGDKVLLVRVENKYGEDQSEGYNLPLEVTISRTDDTYDFAVEDSDGNFLTHVDEKNLQPIDAVSKQTIIRVNDNWLAVQYTTNTNRNRVSIQRRGQTIGRVKFDEIDKVIGLLTKLKEEV